MQGGEWKIEISSPDMATVGWMEIREKHIPIHFALEDIRRIPPNDKDPCHHVSICARFFASRHAATVFAQFGEDRLSHQIIFRPEKRH